MMVKTKLFSFLVAVLIGSNACNQNGGDEEILLPGNLEIHVEEVGNGEVKVSFKADNTNFYVVNSGMEGAVSVTVYNNELNYQYTKVGTYTIEVQAHATTDAFISGTSIIEITETSLGLGIPETGFESPVSYEGYNLVWQDEFDGTELSDDWVFEIGDGCPNLCGWGNNELEYYRRENTVLKDGYLIIHAKQEEFGGKNYTSSRIKTQNRQSFTFGRVDVRAVLPKGQGIWPAIWMLGESISEISWPASGEIDIMEMVGGSANGRDNTVHGTIHFDNNGTYVYTGGSVSLVEGIFNDEFHVFSIIWDEEMIIWLLDDEEFHREDISAAAMEELRKPFFFLFNVAVGGNWPGSPDASTVFPQQMVVDYIRVFQKD